MARTNIRVSAIILKDNKMLLIHRKKDGEEYWVFPGGGVEDAETPAEGIIREVKEETNLDILKCELAFNVYNNATNKMEPFYLCKVSDNNPEMVGEEKYKNSPENWYQLEWAELNELTNLRLVPESAAKEVIKRYTQS